MNSRNPMGRRNATLSILLACAAIGGAAGIATAQAAPAPSAPSSAMRASSIFGTTGTAPNSVVVDSAGNAYTANSGANNVSMITPAGVSTILGTTGAMPMGIALDSAGNVYTSNIGANTVTKITPAGVSTTLGTTGNKPMGIKVDSSGNVYTTNYIDSTVTKITPAGVSSTLAATGKHPLGIVLDSSGNVYTANEATGTITKITPAGVASTLGKTGSFPQAIAMDGSGNLYTANWNSKNVSKVTPKGASKILGTTGRRPIGITVDTSGNVYTTNNGADSVSRVTQSGQSRIIALTERRPSGITIDTSGNLYTANFLSNTVSKISASAATRSSTVTLSTVTVGSPNNPSAWIIPFYNSVYQSQASCISALNAIIANPPATYDPSVQKETLIPGNCVQVGGVKYAFNVGEMEVTTAQWVTFLNTADPMGLNRHHLWDAAESSSVWPKYGSVNRNMKAAPGQRYYVASPGWANRPYNSADFSRAARFINSMQNGKLVSKKTKVVTTVNGTALKTTSYTVRLSPKTETGMYTMSNRKATRNSTKGFALTSQDEWIKAAYFDPKGGGTFSYWDYPTNPGQYVNCPVDTSGCAAGDQPNATQMDANGNVTNAAQQPLASYVAVPGTAPDWCPVASLTPAECTADTPFPPALPYNGNVSPVGQALTRSPWGTLDQGGNVVEALDTISAPPALSNPKIVWRRWHGGVVTATAYQMWLSAIGSTPQTIPGYAINPWRGFRIAVRGK
jgi:sugar lactone lactonase YvrE